MPLDPDTAQAEIDTAIKNGWLRLEKPFLVRVERPVIFQGRSKQSSSDDCTRTVVEYFRGTLLEITQDLKQIRCYHIDENSDSNFYGDWIKLDFRKGPVYIANLIQSGTLTRVPF